MNKTLTSITVFFMILSLVCLANEGCLDNKNRTRKEGVNQPYRSVFCMCNCERYAWSSDRCQCENCKHYHDPINNFTIKRKWEKEPHSRYLLDIF